MPLKVRQYGSSGPFVILLHGGPAAPGYMKPIAVKLSKHFRVLEPFQRRGSDEPLTVARHVQDLRAIIITYCGGEKPLLVGHSWGAMLALAYAAEYPGSVEALAVISCGSFAPVSRKRLEAVYNERMDEAFRQRIEELKEKYPNPNVRMAIRGGLYQQLDSVDLIKSENCLCRCDAAAHEQTWSDMLRLQAAGVYPQAFAAIDAPVLMLHGNDDPHPGAMIRDCLKPYLPQLEYHSWDRCGHYPWLEKAARKDFYAKLIHWLQGTAT